MLDFSVMKRAALLPAIVAWLLPSAVGADEGPARGKLLVATELVRGEIFAETVILLVHYDVNGALGIVVNRPTDVAMEEVVVDPDAVSAYGGTLYWGGPVRMNSLRALMRADKPPEGAETIIDSVHQVSVNDALGDSSLDPDSLRIYLGYAGWAAGQLDYEIERGSWRILPASDEHVFAEDPRALWKRLTPPREHRADFPRVETFGPGSTVTHAVN